MTRTQAPDASALATAVLAVLVVASSVTLVTSLTEPAAGVPSPRSSVSGPPPVTVFQGEELNVTALELTGGGTIGNGDVTFVGIAGEAEGFIEGGDAASLDLSGWATGTYDADGDDQPELSVREPRVTELTLELDNGANVTNRRAPSAEGATLTADFDFADADGLDVSVRDPDGLDVAPGMASGTEINTGGGSVTLDFSDADPGRYTITVEARTLEASRSIYVDVDTPRLTLGLDPGRVVQGESVRATIRGDPGERFVLRVDEADLTDGSATDDAATLVFGDSATVTARRGSGSAGVVYAVLELDDDGVAVVDVRSQHLRAETTIGLDVGRGSEPTASTVLEGSLQVDPPATTTTPTPTAAPATTSPPSPTPTTTTASETETETDSPTVTTAGSPTATTTEPPGGQPGFGLAAGAVGALVALWVASRRP